MSPNRPQQLLVCCPAVGISLLMLSLDQLGTEFNIGLSRAGRFTTVDAEVGFLSSLLFSIRQLGRGLGVDGSSVNFHWSRSRVSRSSRNSHILETADLCRHVGLKGP